MNPRLPIVVALAGFGALFAAVKADRSAAVDLALTLRLQRRRSRAIRRLLAAASWPGFPPQSRVIPPLVIAAWAVAGRPVDAAFQALAWSGALVSTVVKAAVRRPRPLPPAVEVVVAPLGGTSFPSGHVLTYVTFYGFLAARLATLPAGPDRGGAGPWPATHLARAGTAAGLTGLIALVGPSRVAQGHHWPTDVLASYLLGGATLLALVAARERVTIPWPPRSGPGP